MGRFVTAVSWQERVRRGTGKDGDSGCRRLEGLRMLEACAWGSSDFHFPENSCAARLRHLVQPDSEAWKSKCEMTSALWESTAWGQSTVRFTPKGSRLEV